MSVSDQSPAGTASSTDSLVRVVPDESGLAGRLQRGAELVAELVAGCDHAAVTMTYRRGVETVAGTSDEVRRCDVLQHQLGEGPGLDTVRVQQTVISQNLGAESRWPEWAPRTVAVLGAHATMSLLLHTEQTTVGALSLYADRPDAWTGHSITVAHALAGQLAVAAADAQQIQHRTRAMASRTVIGQAQGILMERLGIDADQAFAYLQRISQDTNRKLVAVAEELVASRQLPNAEPSVSRGRHDGR
jgi:GAF domain-containing protein